MGQVLLRRTGAGFLLPPWVDKGLLTAHSKGLAYDTAFEPTQIYKTEEETLEGCCSPQNRALLPAQSHFPVDDTSHLRMSLISVELWLHPLPAVPAVVQSPITDASSCWSEASASQGLAGAELAAAAQEKPLGAACAHLLSRGWGLLLHRMQEPSSLLSWQHFLGNSCWASNVTFNLWLDGEKCSLAHYQERFPATFYSVQEMQEHPLLSLCHVHLKNNAKNTGRHPGTRYSANCCVFLFLLVLPWISCLGDQHSAHAHVRLVESLRWESVQILPAPNLHPHTAGAMHCDHSQSHLQFALHQAQTAANQEGLGEGQIRQICSAQRDGGIFKWGDLQ